MVNRFDVYLVNLDAEPSKDAKNTRPCVVISPDEMNRHISSVLIAPLSSSSLAYPTRLTINFLNNERAVVLDQIRAVDKIRLAKRIGSIETVDQTRICERLTELFAQ
jgi:mRNA interferase MazF